jgi:hypothetical protein
MYLVEKKANQLHSFLLGPGENSDETLDGAGGDGDQDDSEGR